MSSALLKLAKADERYVISHYEEYLHWRNENSEEAKEWEAKYITEIAGKNPPRVRQGTWSSSSSGTCPRRQQFVYHGFPQRDWETETLNIFSNGDFVHLRYQVAGYIGGWLKEAEVVVSIPEQKVLGTMDGILDNGDILEIKSINPNGYRQVELYGPKTDHQFQATAYCLATGRDTVRFLYENKANNHNREFVFRPSAQHKERVLADWEAMNTAEEAGEFVPMQKDCRMMTGNEYRWCNFKDICLDATHPGKHDQDQA